MALLADTRQPLAFFRKRRDLTFVLLIPLVALLGIVYFWPVFNLLITSVTSPQPGFQNYERFLEGNLYIAVLLRTFFLAGFVTVASVVVSYPIAFAMREASSLGLKVITLLIFLPFWASVMVRTYGLMVIFGRSGVVNNLLISAGIVDSPIGFMYNTWMVRIAMVQIMMPFVILPMYSVFRGIDNNLLQAASGLGAKPWRVFLRVFLPLSMPGVLAGAVLVFVLSLGFFITPALLGGRQDVMISMVILEQFEAQLDWGFGATLSTVVLSIAIATVLVLGRFTNGNVGIKA